MINVILCLFFLLLLQISCQFRMIVGNFFKKQIRDHELVQDLDDDTGDKLPTLLSRRVHK